MVGAVIPMFGSQICAEDEPGIASEGTMVALETPFLLFFFQLPLFCFVSPTICR